MDLVLVVHTVFCAQIQACEERAVGEWKHLRRVYLALSRTVAHVDEEFDNIEEWYS